MASRSFAPSGPLTGTLPTAPDKSISHRAALLAAMAVGTSTVEGYLLGEDTLSTLRVLEQLGAGIRREGSTVEITGMGLRGAAETSEVLDVGNSGTLMRLVSGWLSGQAGRSWQLDGDRSIRSRPMGRIAVPLGQMGAEFELSDGRPPFLLKGASLSGINWISDVASAQVKSAILLAGLLADGPSSVTESPTSRDHTERMLIEQGADLTRQRLQDGSTRVEIKPADDLASVDRSIPGDPSSAAFLVLAAVLVEGSEITVSGVNLNPERTGFFRLLAKMGADISGYEAPPEDFGRISKEPVGDVSARSSSLVGITVGAEEIPAAVDEITLLALAGCFASGTTRVSGAGELKVKETDRIAGVVQLISALGGTIEATEDGFVVTGTGDLRGGTIDSLGDHRLAMLGAVAGLASEQGVTVTDFGAADVSYPGFIADISRLA